MGVSRRLRCYAGTHAFEPAISTAVTPTRLLAICCGYTKLFFVLLDFVLHKGDRHQSNDRGSKLKSRLRRGQRESGL